MPEAAMLITRNSLPHPRLMDMLTNTDLPVLITDLDSFSTAANIHGMTTKIQPGQTDKIALIEQLVQQHVDLPAILGP
jgi:BioD-like phosphotransacetylase family protein